MFYRESWKKSLQEIWWWQLTRSFYEISFFTRSRRYLQLAPSTKTANRVKIVVCDFLDFKVSSKWKTVAWLNKTSLWKMFGSDFGIFHLLSGLLLIILMVFVRTFQDEFERENTYLFWIVFFIRSWIMLWFALITFFFFFLDVLNWQEFLFFFFLTC